MPTILLDPYLDVVIILVGIVLAGSAWLDLRLARAAMAWPTTAGRIASRSTEDAAAEGRNSYLPILTYRYTVDGASYEGNRLSFRTHWTRQGATLAGYHYSPGQQVVVHYHPSTPERSVLELKTDDRPYVRLALGAPILLAGIVLLIW